MADRHGLSALDALRTDTRSISGGMEQTVGGRLSGLLRQAHDAPPGGGRDRRQGHGVMPNALKSAAAATTMAPTFEPMRNFTSVAAPASLWSVSS